MLTGTHAPRSRRIVTPRAVTLLAAILFTIGAERAVSANTEAVATVAADSLAAGIRRARPLMRDTCTIVAGLGDSSAAPALDRALDEIARLEKVLSSWMVDSELTRLNDNGLGFWFTCSPDLYAVIDSSLKFAERTDGAFDPTIEALNKVWDVRGKGRKPKPKILERARSTVGWRHVSKDRDRRRVLLEHEEAGMDLGGIGKGYALAKAAETLRGSGVERALLDFGGEVLALGAWEVAVDDPAYRVRPVVRLGLANAALATSGPPYGKVIDPRGGQPVQTTASVTVVSRSATEADALSTAFLVMGREAAAEYVIKRPRLGLLWLEPAAGGVQAWRWNLTGLTAEPGIQVEWMN